MKMPTRQRPVDTPPGLRAQARVDRRVRPLLSRLSAGCVVVIDQADLDRATAQSLVDAGVAAVVNASPYLSGRYPALGPQLLADAGTVLVEGVGPEVFAQISDGQTIRLHEGTLYVGERAVASGRVLGPEEIAADMAAAQTGLASQLESFTLNSAELLRLEPDLLLHGQGLPEVRALAAGRPAVVAIAAHDTGAELRQLRGYLKDARPALVGVDRGADLLRKAGHQPHLVVVDARTEDRDLPSAAVLKAAREVIVRVDPGGTAAAERIERLGVRPRCVETTLTAEDVALLLATAGEASLIVGVGLRATLEDFLDHEHAAPTSTWLTRLRVGPLLVDATAVPRLYSGRLRPRHLFLAILVGLLALAAAIAVTPVGQEWWDEIRDSLVRWYDTVNGAFS